MPHKCEMPIAGVILGGGAGRRMGGRAKPALMLGGQTLLAHVQTRIAGQVSVLALAARTRPEGCDLPLLADRHADRRGPLAGILAGMLWAREALPEARFLLSLPCDAPFLPRDLVPRLLTMLAAEPEARVILACSGGVEHRAVALWDVALAGPLAEVVERGEDLSIHRFYRRVPHALCDFAAPPSGPISGPISGPDPFLNINTPEDLARAEDALRMGKHLEPIVPRNADEGEAGGLGLPHGKQGGG